MAHWVVRTGIQPSEWKALALFERAKVKDAYNDLVDEVNRSR